MDKKNLVDSRLLEIIRATRRVVVKVGSSILVGTDGKISARALTGIARGIALIQKNGVHVILVSSGAIACGMQALKLVKKPRKISELQACAAIGQPVLIQLYHKALDRERLKPAQLLLTRSDLEDRTRFLNAKQTLAELFHRKLIPIINENDTVAVEEIRVGDNDNLSALVTNLVDADLLILLTDQEGLFTADPRKDPGALRIPVVENVDGTTLAYAADTLAARSVGGMKTKLEAAQKAAEFGIPTVIADGLDARALERIFAGELTGTLFLPRLDSLTARQHWIAFTLQPAGSLTIDDGAKQALTEAKKSLLPSGVVGVQGKFLPGDPVDVIDREGNRLGRGLISYDSEEVTKLLGRRSTEIEKLLGYKGPDELIHRNNFVRL